MGAAVRLHARILPLRISRIKREARSSTRWVTKPCGPASRADRRRDNDLRCVAARRQVICLPSPLRVARQPMTRRKFRLCQVPRSCSEGRASSMLCQADGNLPPSWRWSPLRADASPTTEHPGKTQPQGGPMSGCRPPSEELRAIGSATGQQKAGASREKRCHLDNAGGPSRTRTCDGPIMSRLL